MEITISRETAISRRDDAGRGIAQFGRPQIVLVSAAGGGVRAAYWTSFLLARATKPTGGMRDKLVMASGVSGGSLGLAVYRGLLQDSPPDCGVSAHETPLVNCVQNFFRNDFLAPPLAATLSGRLFNRLCRCRLFRGRINLSKEGGRQRGVGSCQPDPTRRMHSPSLSWICGDQMAGAGPHWC